MHVLDDETRRFGRMLHYAGVLVAVVCATAAYSFLHAPTVQAIESTSARIDEVLLSVQNAPLIQEQHQKVSQTLAKVKEQIATIQQRVPQTDEAGEFLKAVTKIAGEENFAIKNFQPEKPANRDGYAEREVTLKGQGSYESICTFVDRLGKMTRLSKVKTLRLAVGDTSTQYPVTATLVIYFGLQGKNAKDSKEASHG
jgi:Tfp pilus assembly protein PilO